MTKLKLIIFAFLEYNLTHILAKLLLMELSAHRSLELFITHVSGQQLKGQRAECTYVQVIILRTDTK
jgi:hypothetical protein